MTLRRRTPLRSKAPPPRPARQWEGPAPAAKPTAAGSGLVAAALALPELDAPSDGPSDAAGRRYLGRVAALPCRLCLRLGRGQSAAEVHHLRTGTGAGTRASHWLTLAACPKCHRGPHGLHGDKSLLRIAGVTELDLLADTIAAIAEGVSA
jgi:hypothetical protein